MPRVVDEALLTQANAEAQQAEGNAYKILGKHDRIVNCLYISPAKELIALEFYPHGNLKDYVAKHGAVELRKWARQMIEGVAYMHSKGIRHSDLRLDQFLLDNDMNVRLSDFNGIGMDGEKDIYPEFDFKGHRNINLENESHRMPRVSGTPSTEVSDLFALGSTFYELEHGSEPYEGLYDRFKDEDEGLLLQRWVDRDFPSVDHLELGPLILGCWESKYSSAAELLEEGDEICGHGLAEIQASLPERPWSQCGRRSDNDLMHVKKMWHQFPIESRI